MARDRVYTRKSSINTVGEGKLPPRTQGINSGNDRVSKEVQIWCNSAVAALNRRMRIRTYGGVGGGEHKLPLPDLKLTQNLKFTVIDFLCVF